MNIIFFYLTERLESHDPRREETFLWIRFQFWIRIKYTVNWKSCLYIDFHVQFSKFLKNWMQCVEIGLLYIYIFDIILFVVVWTYSVEVEH